MILRKQRIMWKVKRWKGGMREIKRMEGWQDEKLKG